MKTTTSATFPETSRPLPSATTKLCLPSGALPAAATCRETMRLLRRIMSRMLWPQLPFAERARLARDVRRLTDDLALALLILEKGKVAKL